MPFHVLELHAENYKRLKAVTIRPSEDVVLIGGRNAQGKTSVLDAIYAVLKGGAAARETVQPIRDGQDTAIAQVKIGDEAGNVLYVVTRRWAKDDAGTLTVESADHARFSSPQKLLDGMLGAITLDPLAFTRMDGKSQLRTLIDVLGDSLGFDPVQLDAERKGVYDRRTEVSREVVRLEGQLAGYPDPDPTLPADEISSGALLAEATEISELNAQRDRAVEACERASANREAAEEAVRVAQRNLSTARLEEAEELAALRELPAHRDVAEVRDRLANVEQTNARIRAQRDRRAVADELSDRKNDRAALTLKLAEIDRRKAEGIAAAELPVAGLGFTADGVTLNGIPFSQASTSEQIRVSTALAMADAPDIRVMRIDGGESLDSDSLAIVEQLAAEHRYQVWISRVDESQSVGFTIEDGAVA